MPQIDTGHTPPTYAEESLGDQILCRLDEIIGLLDGIGSQLEIVVAALPCANEIAALDATSLALEDDLLALLLEKSETDTPQ